MILSYRDCPEGEMSEKLSRGKLSQENVKGNWSGGERLGTGSGQGECLDHHAELSSNSTGTSFPVTSP